MANWRVSGFVPDSDEEEELTRSPVISLKSQRDKAEVNSEGVSYKAVAPNCKPELKNNHHVQSPNCTDDNDSTASKLERVFSHGLQIVRDVRAAVPSIALDDLESDSPLSTPPSSREHSPSVAFDTTLNTQQPNASLLFRLASSTQRDDAPSPPRRNLRERAPIQQHPYLLEDAHYRQQMKGSGVRPITVPTASKASGRDHPNGESQQVTDNYILQPEDSFNSTLRTSLLSTQASDDTAHETNGLDSQLPLYGDADDELPEFSDILRHRRNVVKQKSKSLGKPQLIVRVPSAKTSTRAKDVYDFPTDEDVAVNGNLSRDNSFRVPPSPPHSASIDLDGVDSEAPLWRNEDETGDIAATPRLPLTPLLSSETRSRKRPRVVPSSSESSESSEEEDTRETSSLSGEDDSQGIRAIKARLRGKLPASHVTIEMRDRNRTPKQNRRLAWSPIKSVDMLGVARKTTTNARSTHMPLANMFLGESESESEDSGVAPHKSRGDLLSPELIEDDSLIMFDGLMDGPEIDPMLTKDTKSRALPRKHKLHQRSITNGWAISNHKKTSETRHAGTSATHKTSMPKRQAPSKGRRKRRQRTPLLDINVLDAPGIRNIEREKQASFLKLAARQAKRTSSKPRQSSAKKFFLLATEQDTLEVNDQLKEYKRAQRTSNRTVSGANVAESVAQMLDVASTDKAPVCSRPNREISLRSTPASAIDQLKQSTRTLLSRMFRREANVPNQTLRLTGAQHEGLVNSDTLCSSTRRHYLPFARQNRSGNGQFLLRLQQPRAAQLESELADVEAHQKPATQRTQLEPIVVQNVQMRSPAASDLVSSPLNRKKPQRNRKKQTPRKSTLPTAIMSPEASFDTTEEIGEIDVPDDTQKQVTGQQAESHVLPKGWIERALSQVSMLKTLPEFTTFRDNAIGDGALLAAIERASNPYYDPLAYTDKQTAIRPPASLQATLCGLCDTEISTLITATLCGISRAVETNTDEYHDSFPWSDDEMYNRCIEFVQSLVQYVADSIFFYDMESVASFVLSSVVWLESFVELPALQGSLTKTKLNDVIRCLNWLMIYTLQLHTLVRASPLLQKKTCAAFERIMDLVFKLALRPQNLAKCVERLQNCCDESITSNMGIFDSTFPEAESIVIAWHVCKALSSDNSTKQFYQHCLPPLALHQTAHVIDLLSLRVLALCFVLPLTHISPIGHTFRTLEDAEQTDGACFNLLSSYLRHLTTHVSINQAPASVGQLVEAIEDLCLKSIQLWRWPAPHTIAVSFLKTYVWNSMLPFNTVPSQESVFTDLRCITGSRSVADNDFFKFLTIVGICIQEYCDPKSNTTDDSIAPSASKIRGFIFSLVPNNARPHDARHELSAAQFLALKNHFALYLTLYRHAPDGCRPRIQQLENQVDLTLSHFMVCKLSVIAWETVAIIDVQHTNSANEALGDVGWWMNNMLKQATVRLKDHEQPDGITLLRELLSALGTVLGKCNSEATARVLLGGDTFATISQLMVDNGMHYKNEGVLMAGLKAMESYMRLTPTSCIKDTLTAEIQLVVKHLLQQILSTEELGSNAFVRQLMAVWMATAQPMVRSFHKYWNDYVDPHSGLSIDFLSGLRNSYAVNEVKECFYSELIEADQQFFFLECRPIVFATWIATLLLPIHLLRFEHVLTNKILQHERDSLMISDLAMTLLKHDNKRELTIQDIADSRITILRHVIQNIYGQSAAPEDEWLAGGLDPSSLTRLLNTMTTTMKSIWLDLKEDPVAQNDYTALVHAIINELETYPYPDFKIDAWFTDGIEFPRPEQTLDNIFKCRFGEGGGEIVKSSIVTFRHMVRRATGSRGQALLVEDLIRVFHCLDPLRVKRTGDGNGDFEYSIDLAKQARFIQIVIPAYFERANHSIGPGILSPILEFLIYITEHIHFRIDNIDPHHMVQFITALAANLCAVRNLLEATKLKHACTALILEFVRIASVSIFSLLDHGVKVDETIFEQVSGNILGIFAVVQAHLPPPKPVAHPSHIVQASDSTDVDGGTTVIRDNVVYDAWTDPPGKDSELVPENMTWTLHFDAQEPPLDRTESDLRDFTRRDLDSLRGVGFDSGLVRNDLEEEMWAFVRVVKGMKLVADFGGDWVEHDELEYE